MDMTKTGIAAIERAAAHENCACVPEGWKLVPVEPSIAACINGAAATDNVINGHAAAQVYSAMLAAAPAAPTEGARDASAQQDEREAFALVPRVMTAAMINAWSGGKTVTTDEVAVCTTFQDAWKRVLDAVPRQVQADAAVGTAALQTNGVDEYGPLLLWHKHWASFPHGTKFYAHPDPLLAECAEALDALLGPDSDPNIGWFGNAKTSPNHFRCEHCGAEDLDCSKIPHALACRVVKARAFLAKVQAAKEGES